MATVAPLMRETNNNARPALKCRALTPLKSPQPSLFRMPIHAHDGTERLQPKGMSTTAQQLITPVMVHYRLTHHGTETGHAILKPSPARVRHEAKEGASRSARHRISLSTY